ncbi:MAG: membrane dipeptidase [Faecalibacterium sp.]|nr:membrane dipeptidase [Ruminococcus sp.]MCM1393037.1 membrane dipeptidase [Ruminococcus sp.]MCM1484959.1 membrane dipeptidase [Faecalibacterium sp.]
MEYFDLHCDTVEKAFSNGLDFESEKLQVNVQNTKEFKKYNQCFALWLNDNFHGKAAFDYATELYKYYLTGKSILPGNIKPFLTLENAVSLGGKLENISLWKERSVCAMTLTWNGENELACGADIASGGLTAFGRDAVREAQRQNIIIDVSHLNEDSFCDTVRIMHQSFIASHSCCFSICPHRRNLKDWQIKEIIGSHGLIGINFYHVFLGDGNIFERIYQNICHISELGGEKSIAFGSDFDGSKMNRRLKDPSKIGELHRYLKKKGIAESTLDDIFFKNAEKFFNNVLLNQ